MDFTKPTINILAFNLEYLSVFPRGWSRYHGNNKSICKIVRNAFKYLTLVGFFYFINNAIYNRRIFD